MFSPWVAYALPSLRTWRKLLSAFARFSPTALGGAEAALIVLHERAKAGTAGGAAAAAALLRSMSRYMTGVTTRDSNVEEIRPPMMTIASGA
jgi:hypothetical protein